MSKKSFGIISITEKLDVSIFSLFTLLFLFMGQGFLYSFILLSAAAIHELSHIVFLCRFGAVIQSITIYPFGIDLVCNTEHLSYKKELVVTLSGCFANLLFSFFGFIVMLFISSPPILFFVVCNLFFALFNFIPLSFFDGGKALRLVLYDRLEIDTAFYLSKYTDIFSSLIFLFLSMYLLDFSNFNLSVCALIVYACISCLASNTFLNKNALT